MIYFTSDLHFGHAGIMKSCGRPFESVDEMNKTLIRNWNAWVSPYDEVYILGDLTMQAPNRAEEYLKQLNGRKYMITGNHDTFLFKDNFDTSLFEWVKTYYELHYKDELFVLFHYPILEWRKSLYGSYHLHGHQHNHADYNLENREAGIRRYDVGVDANDYSPVSIKEIIDFFKNTQE